MMKMKLHRVLILATLIWLPLSAKPLTFQAKGDVPEIEIPENWVIKHSTFDTAAAADPAGTAGMFLDSVKIGSIQEAQAKRIELIKKHLGPTADFEGKVGAEQQMTAEKFSEWNEMSGNSPKGGFSSLMIVLKGKAKGSKENKPIVATILNCYQSYPIPKDQRGLCRHLKKKLK
jgi:hypothetical protein